MRSRRPARKVSRARGGPSLPTPIDSTRTTPLSSAYPSTYASEAEYEAEDEISKIPIHALTLSEPTDGLARTAKEKKPDVKSPFRFMDLPAELRIDIYAHHFDDIGHVIDLDPDNYKHIHKKLAILRTCKAVYAEASQVFYGMHTFRLFPTQSGRFETKKPLLARLNARQRGWIKSLELRLGPGWHKPPKGWVVNSALGLADCVNVRKLTVFVQFDPSDGFFSGFRRADGFYEAFSKNLLDNVLCEMPFLDCVHFDAWSSIKKSGAMMTGLLEVAAARGRRIGWGPERQWTDHDEMDEAMLPHAAAATARLGGLGMDTVIVA
ncbi:3 exoribonuclease family protein [Madurella fahalii]|uniref:3 exoribonuclease family protein n=1 Tax=Madurella fahalii TaxID=1157608 RepID=A0ABQ0FWX3_9PEZI